jgi:hypothetical protein
MKQQTFSAADLPTEKSTWQHLEIPISILNQGPSKPLPLALTMGTLI